MIRMSGRANGVAVIGFGLTRADMAKLLQGERIATRMELTDPKGEPLPPIEVVLFGGEDQVSMTLDWQKHMGPQTGISGSLGI